MTKQHSDDNHDLSVFPIADHPLSDIEIQNRHGDYLADFIHDVAGGDMRMLTKMASSGQRLIAARATRTAQREAL